MPYAALLERTIPLSRNKVFARLVDFGGIDKLLPEAVESVKMTGDGIGSVRTLRVKGIPGEIVERLEAVIADRLMSYSIINEVGLPLERYHAVVELADGSGGGCTVRWGSNWIAKGAPEAEVRKMLTDLYGGILDGMVKLG